MGMKVSTVTVGETKVDIFVDNGGKFYAEYDEEDYSATTLSEVTDKVKTAVKRAKMQKPIDVTVVDLKPSTKRSGSGYGYSNEPYEHGRGLVNLKLRAKHERNWNSYLYADGQGRKFSLSRGGDGSHRVLRKLTVHEAVEYERLTTALDEAQAKYDAWLKTRALNLDETLKAGTAVTAVTQVA